MDRRSELDESSIELEALRSARADPVPDLSIIDAHREGLATAVGRERISPRDRQALRRVAVAAAAASALVGAAVLVGSSGPDGDDLGDVELAASSAFYGAPRCGSDPPPEVNIPDGFSGPIDGPSPDSDRSATDDQLVRHWTSPTASIEVRWFADSDATPPAFPEPQATVEDAGTALEPDHPVFHDVDDVLITLGRSAAASERRYGGLLYGTDAGQPDDPCTWAQVTVFDNDAEQVNDTLGEATRLCDGQMDVVEVQELAANMDERDNGRPISIPDVWDDCDD